METTLFIIKPDAVERRVIGKILAAVEDSGFKIIRMRMVTLNEDLARKFYAIHKDKHFFNDLIRFMTSRESVVCVLEKENAVTELRKLVGETDPLKSLPGTIRRCFGTDIQMNGVHASDSAENARKEIYIMFEK